MDYGERLNGAESGDFTPDMLPRPELSTEKKEAINKNLGRVNKAATELETEGAGTELSRNPLEGYQDSAGFTPESGMESETLRNRVEGPIQPGNEVALGEITDETMTRPVTEEVLLSTETGSIPDKDGVEKDVEERVEQIQKNPDLGKRSMEYALARRQFMVGRYADRSYMRGDEVK